MPQSLRVIIKISGTDPHKECKVTLSKKSKKDIVVGIYKNILKDLEEASNPGEKLKPYYEKQLKAWQEWEEGSSKEIKAYEKLLGYLEKEATPDEKQIDFVCAKLELLHLQMKNNPDSDDESGDESDKAWKKTFRTVVGEKCPSLGKLPFEPEKVFTGFDEDDIVAVDATSSYDFHYIVEDRVWDDDEDLEIIVNEH